MSDVFQQHLRHIPSLSVDRWLLVTDGFVTQNLTVNYKKLIQLPSAKRIVAITCGGHTPDAPMLGQAVWQGLPVSWLRDYVKPDERATVTNIYSADGYATSLPVDALDDTLLAYQMNGDPLSAAHGYPLRLVVPGRSGYKMPKWITRIVFSDTPVHSYWEQRGWHTDGTVTPLSATDAPTSPVKLGNPVTLTGDAYGGHKPVVGVQVSINGSTWANAAFWGGQPGTLARWQLNWTPATSGFHTLHVRAQTPDATQPDATQPAITVEVTA